MSKFKYLEEKILNSPFLEDPFRHLEINNFFKPEHLEIILSDDQIHFEESKNINDLIQKLYDKDYMIQSFPGCCTDAMEYIDRLEKNNWPSENKGNPVSSYGITFRISNYRNAFIKELVQYLNGDSFHNALREKFGIKEESSIITAIQKNLSKYEISPHPDVKRKCMTYLLNINKDDSIENKDVHTHLLKFKKEYEYVYDLWENNPEFDRAWVPWSWCKTSKVINKNNTIVIFPPSNKTLHAVKLDYDHTKFQRTQIYGNLMYPNRPKLRSQNYKDLTR